VAVDEPQERRVIDSGTNGQIVFTSAGADRDFAESIL
jgi:hypothetical protein